MPDEDVKPKVVEVQRDSPTFHPQGTVMEIQNAQGKKIRYVLTPGGWVMVSEP
jgi:hypothetical protein